MVLKNELIKDLKKSNKELEKHLEKLNIDNLDISSNLNNKSKIDELLSIGIIDLRTEVSLLRKNLSVDIENMVLKQVNNSQQKFFENMNEFQNKISLELKKNFSNYILDLNSNLNKLKIEISNLENKSQNIYEEQSIIRDEILNFKEEFLKKITNTNTKNTQNNQIENKIDFILEKINDSESKLNKKNNLIENNLINLNKKLINVEHSFENINTEISSEKSIFEEKMTNLNKLVNKKTNKIENSINKLEKPKKNEKILDKIDIKPEIIFEIKEKNKNNSNINKLLNINKRLEKLNSLKN